MFYKNTLVKTLRLNQRIRQLTINQSIKNSAQAHCEQTYPSVYEMYS
jgi:hypothetical protein